MQNLLQCLKNKFFTNHHSCCGLMQCAFPRCLLWVRLPARHISSLYCADHTNPAFQALVLIGEIKPRGDVLVHSGSSGVGTATIQLTCFFGVWVHLSDVLLISFSLILLKCQVHCDHNHIYKGQVSRPCRVLVCSVWVWWLWVQGFSVSMVLWFRGECSSSRETEVERGSLGLQVRDEDKTKV